MSFFEELKSVIICLLSVNTEINLLQTSLNIKTQDALSVCHQCWTRQFACTDMSSSINMTSGNERFQAQSRRLAGGETTLACPAWACNAESRRGGPTDAEDMQQTAEQMGIIVKYLKIKIALTGWTAESSLNHEGKSIDSNTCLDYTLNHNCFKTDHECYCLEEGLQHSVLNCRHTRCCICTVCAHIGWMHVDTA